MRTAESRAQTDHAQYSNGLKPNFVWLRSHVLSVGTVELETGGRRLNSRLEQSDFSTSSRPTIE